MRLTIFAAASILACGLSAAALAQPPAPATATAAIMGQGNKDLGTATFTESPRGVLVKLELKGLTPGWHGLHLHEKGACSNADFTSAGAHVHEASPTPAIHGLLNPDATDKGDLPNIYAAADGTAHAEVYSTYVALKSPAGRPALLDTDGSAIVVHASADDHKAQPIGGSGARVGCGVIK